LTFTILNATAVQGLQKPSGLLGGVSPYHNLYVSVANGVQRVENWTLGTAIGGAGVAASAPATFPVKKNGAANGSIVFTGTSITDNIVSRSYPLGSLFELYPPATADTTLDDISLSIPVTIA